MESVASGAGAAEVAAADMAVAAQAAKAGCETSPAVAAHPQALMKAAQPKLPWARP